MNEPIFEITPPQIRDIECGSTGKICVGKIYDYENSHIIYKGLDLGSFEELYNIKKTNIDIDKFISYYEQCIENIEFINKLIKNTRFRKSYCKMNNIDFLCIAQLEKDKKREYEEKRFMDMFIIKQKNNKYVIDEIHNRKYGE